MKSLFLDIKSRIINNIPEITYVRMFNNQLQNAVNNNSTYDFPIPCVFVEFDSPNEPKQLGVGFQIYEPLYVKLHLVVNELDSADGNLDQNLNIFDLKDSLYTIMQKFNPDKASIFIRSSEEQDYDHDNIYVWKQTYTTTYIDGLMEEPINFVYNSPEDTNLTITKNII